jgi:hypothetical protein
MMTGDGSVLSLTNSIDCFSDEDVDIYEPPVRDRNDDADCSTSEVVASIQKASSKPEIYADLEQPSSKQSLIDTRDAEEEVVSKETPLVGTRESMQEESENIAVGHVKDDDISVATRKLDVEHSVSYTELQPIATNLSKVTVVPYPTVEMVEVFSKLEDKSKSFDAEKLQSVPLKTSPQPSLSVASKLSQEVSFDSKNISATLSAGSDAGKIKVKGSKATKSNGSFGSPQPSVSFADEVSRSESDGLQKGSGLSSHRSLYSRKSVVTVKKSRSKDSVAVESGKELLPKTSMISVASYKGDKESNNSLKSSGTSKNLVVEKSDSSKDGMKFLSTLVSDKEECARVDAPSKDIEEVMGGDSSNDAIVAQETTIDDNKPPAPSLPPSPQGDIKTSRSKESSSSQKSTPTKNGLFLKISRSKECTGSDKGITSPVVTPKVYGPPRRLPRWGGIPKPEVLPGNGKSDKTGGEVSKQMGDVSEAAKGEDNETLIIDEHKSSKISENEMLFETFPEIENVEKATIVALDDCNSVRSKQSMIVKTEDAVARESVPFSPPTSPDAIEPPENPMGGAFVENPEGCEDHDFSEGKNDEEPCIDATSTLTSTSSSHNEVNPKLQVTPSKSSTCEHSTANNGTQNSEKDSKSANVTSKNMDGDETRHSNSNTKGENGRLIIDVDTIENDPIEAVMKPFSPIAVPVCSTQEDQIMRKVSHDCLSTEAIETVDDRDITTPDKTTTTNVDLSTTNVLIRRKTPLSVFGFFGKTKRMNATKSNTENIAKADTSLMPQMEESEKAEKSERTIDMLKGDSLLQTPQLEINSFVDLTSPKKAAIVESATSDEVEVVKHDSPKKFRSGFFGSGSRRMDKVNHKNTANKNKTFEMIVDSDFDDSPKGATASYHNQESMDMDSFEKVMNLKPHSDIDTTSVLVDKNTDELDLSDRDIAYADESEEVKIGLDTIGIPEAMVPAAAKVSKKSKGAFFMKSRISNEKKRLDATSSNKKTRKIGSRQKEREVKISALIDEKVVVESLHLACTESPKKTPKAVQSGPFHQNFVIRDSQVPMNPTDNFTPIIMVDHRRSKEVETIGKLPSGSKLKLQGRLVQLLSPFSRSAKLNAKEKTVEPVEAVVDERGYTSGDTTEANEVELTQVAQLDVPLGTNYVDTIPKTVFVDDASHSNIETRDIKHPMIETQDNSHRETMNDVKCDAALSWTANIVDWFTPRAAIGQPKEETNNLAAFGADCGALDPQTLKGKANTAKSDKIGLSGVPVSDENTVSSHLEEAIAEFNECHNFYAMSCMKQRESDDRENKQSKNIPAVNEATVENSHCHNFYPKSWTENFVEWISPTVGEKVTECRSTASKRYEEEFKTQRSIALPIEISEVKVNTDHEGTEIALAIDEPEFVHIDTLRQVAPELKHTAVPNGVETDENKKVSSQSDAHTIKPFRAPFLTRVFGKKSEKPTGSADSLVYPAPIRALSCQNESTDKARDKTSGEIPKTFSKVKKTCAEENLPPTTLPPLEKERVEIPNTTLFTFTSDDCPTESTQNGDKFEQMSVETKTLPQKDWCGIGNSQLLKSIIGLDDDTSRNNNNLHHFIAGQPQMVELDDDVESSVGYLAEVKSKRLSRKKLNEKSEKSTEEIHHLTEAKSDKNEEKLDQINCRVSAVSDEELNEMKTNVSYTSSFPASFLTSKEEHEGKDSYLSSKEEKEGTDIPVLEKAKMETLAQGFGKRLKTKRGVPATKTNRRPTQRKEEDSVGVTVNSQLNTFDDDLSGVFAPVTRGGKWLW